MLYSNIDITPNLYVITHDMLLYDSEYISHVTGPKRLKDIQSKLGSLSSIRLNDVQMEIVRQNAKCAYAKDGQVPFGPVMVGKELAFSCRCENKECPYYSTCMNLDNAKQIIRQTGTISDTKDNNKKFHDYLNKIGISLSDSVLEVKRNKNKEAVLSPESSEVQYQKPEEPQVNSLKNLEYELISNSDCIITSPADSHILLNSGPGTGKTYTIIHRLIYLLQNELCPAEEIYILCYTRSAKKVIEDKIDEAVRNEVIPASAKNICILTFDSYATYFLIALQDFEEVDFSDCSYNERIKLFNDKCTKEDFENISYFIVDEIQDLVNDRAKMVLKILENIECGFLLAGDRCQSIYDYEADNDASFDSEKFYNALESVLPYDIKRYEISENRRQSAALSYEEGLMRDVLLHKSIREQNEYAEKVIKQYENDIKIEKFIKSLDCIPDKKTAILCRNNGEAEYISVLLCKKKMLHKLNRGVNNADTLPRWIADVFWDYCKDNISKKEFLQRFTFRSESDLDPDALWDILLTISEQEDGVFLSLKKLLAAISVVNDIPKELCESSPNLIVSTIHKAKGSEYDNVILVESEIEQDNNSAEEARVRYVALTRPKNDLVLMKKNKTNFKRTMSGRVIKIGRHNYGKLNSYCHNIVIGMSGDIDCNSFVEGDYKETVELQEYISKNVKIYDEITVQLSQDNGKYEVFHNERKLGTLSDHMKEEIRMGIRSTDYKNKMPVGLTEIYISGITTELIKKYDDKVPLEFQQSKICYGIQITGLARLIFEKE